MKVRDYKDRNVFGVPLQVIVQRTGQPLPQGIQQAMRFLRNQCLDQVTHSLTLRSGCYLSKRHNVDDGRWNFIMSENCMIFFTGCYITPKSDMGEENVVPFSVSILVRLFRLSHSEAGGSGRRPIPL